jgi:hypothetical protein
MQQKNCQIDSDGPRFGLRCEIAHTEIGDKWVSEFQDIRKLIINKTERNTGEEIIVISSSPTVATVLDIPSGTKVKMTGPTIFIDLTIQSGGRFELLFPDKVPSEKTTISLTTKQLGVDKKSEFNIHIEKLNRPFRNTEIL